MADRVKILPDGRRIKPLPAPPEGQKREELEKRFGGTLLTRKILVDALVAHDERRVAPLWRTLQEALLAMEQMDDQLARMSEVVNALNDRLSEHLASEHVTEKRPKRWWDPRTWR